MLFQTEGADKLEEAKKEAQAVQKLQSLFKGLKFFVGREVPRESVVFIIRSCDGQVSWDSTLFPGATYDETDETITHQIVDRPTVEKQYLSRYFSFLYSLYLVRFQNTHLVFLQLLHSTSMGLRLHQFPPATTGRELLYRRQFASPHFALRNRTSRRLHSSRATGTFSSGKGRIPSRYFFKIIVFEFQK